ncbi:hypothetical protein B566_EDAN005788 [Ephemera danica]|nr:hypothetical protein B566_EDAN005788 [Ephemera danica]
MNPSPTSPLPVTLLSGFLGAGKTTLLNALLSAHNEGRFAIIENEFGAVNIDSQLIARQNGGIIELTNGCICCTVNDDLVRGLEELHARRASGELSFDWIVIETTGLADPGAVAQTFFAAPELRDTFMLDGIITVVDALHAAQQLDEHPLVARQIGFADRLLIAKSDSATAATLAALAKRLSAINARAAQFVLINGRLPDGTLPPILGIGGFDLDNSLLAAPFLRYAPVNASASALGSRKRPRAHADNIRSVLLEGGDVDLAAVDQFVETLINEFADKLLRYKGILALTDEPRRLIFQGVQRVAGFDYGTPWEIGETRSSRIVLIGKDLPVAELEARFAATAAKAPPP